VSLGILLLPKLDNDFRRFVQPIRVSQQLDQFDGAKEFTALGLGLPSACSFPALTKKATSSAEQFNSFATCSARRCAGVSFAAHVANMCKDEVQNPLGVIGGGDDQSQTGDSETPLRSGL
jgi:hypothetical protein